MKDTRVSIKLSNGKTIPAIKYESEKGYTGKAPLIVYLSGSGQQLNESVTPARIEAAYKEMSKGSQLEIMANAETFGFKIIVPLFVLEFNQWERDFTGGIIQRDVANWAIQNMDIDPLRMIPYGWSSGANGVVYSATSDQEIADMWAALVIIAAGGVKGGWEKIKNANLPVWLFHSKDDKAISLGTANDNIKALKALKMTPEPIFTIYESGGHEGAVKNAAKYVPLFQWMAAQRSNYVPPTIPPMPEPFKPTHRITRADGTSELVKLDTSF